MSRPNSYRELKNRIQDENNAFPMGFCFSDAQYKDMMQKWGLDPDKDTDKIISVGGVGFIRKSDKPSFLAMHKKFAAMRKEFFASDTTGERGGHLYDAFRYELANHEYGYTREEDTVHEALDAVGIEWNEVLKHPHMKKALLAAIEDIEHEGDTE